VLLCGHHHRLLHEGGWRVTWWGAGSPAFFDPRGRTHFDGRWKPPALPQQQIEVMIAADSRGGSSAGGVATGESAPNGATAGARWKREADIPDEVYYRALEAIG